MKALTLVVLTSLVVVATLAVHWPVLSARAMTFDDDEYLTNNVLVRNPGWASAGRFLREVLEPSTVRGYYQPLTMISLMLDCAMGGSPENLRPFHRTSLALHVVNTVLIIAVIYGLFGQSWVAAMIGLVFGTHPMTVEPIAWVGDRKTTLAACFALCSILMYLTYVRARSAAAGRQPASRTWRSAWPYGLSLLAYGLALMSKPTATLLPGALVLMDFWPLRRLSWRAVLEKIPFGMVSVVSAVITVVSQARTAAVGLPSSGSTVPALLGFCHNVIFYPLKIIWPVNLTPLYVQPEPLSPADPLLLGAVVATVCLVTALVISLKWTRALLTGWLIFLCIIFPTTAGVGFTIVIASDKYAYLPAVGLLLTAAWVTSRLWTAADQRPVPFVRRAGIVLVLVLLAAAESVGTRRTLAHWQDTERLYRHILALAPQAAVAHSDLALEFVRQGRYEEAVAGYRQALALAPRDPVVHNNLCEVLVKTGRFQEAAQDCLTAIELRPGYAEAYNNLGAAYLGMGMTEKAAEAIDNALRYKPDHAEAHANLAHVLESRGQPERAVECYRRAFRLKPDGRFLLALGDVLARSGDTDGALAAFLQGYRGSSAPAEAHRRLANLLAATGNTPLAEEHYREALRLAPDSVHTHNDYGAALAQWGRRSEAIAQFRRAIDLDGTQFAARCNLGLALSEEGRLDEAVEVLTVARRSLPGCPQIEHTLGMVLLGHGKPDDAETCFRRALEFDPHFEPARRALDQCRSRSLPLPDLTGNEPAR